MRISRLIFQEIRYRKLSFALGVLSVVIAVGCGIGMLAVVAGHDVRTREIVERRQRAVVEMMRQNEEEYRKITKAMGFNMVILHRSASVSDFYANSVVDTEMDESWGKKIADAKLASVNHVTPVLQKRIKWEELGGRDIFLTGVKVAYVQGKFQQPIQKDVAPGDMILGHELQATLNVKLGDKAKLLGREFTIRGFTPGRYNRDDITVWINLGDAQQVLNRPGKINGIFALECLNCGPAGFATVRQDIARILPDAQVIEFAQLAAIRTDSRLQAAALTRIAGEQEIQHRAQVAREQRAMAGMLIPLALIGCGLWIAILTLNNVRERGGEIGILRAIGLRSSQILLVFLGKAIAMGIVGGVMGCAAGMVAARLFQGSGIAPVRSLSLVIALAGAPLLAALAAWGPAMLAAYRDPAVLLRED